jgi:hypothetical protein
MQFTQAYPYMATSLVMLGCAALLLISRPATRGAALLSGLLSMPFALFSFEFVGVYWHPRTVAYWRATSPEDLLFSFSTGVIVWSLATWLGSPIPILAIDTKRLVQRYLALSALGIGTGYFFKFFHPIGVMNSAMVGIGLVGLVVAASRRDAWRLALGGLVGFGAFYIGLGALISVLWPSFVGQWQSGEMLRFSVLGLPGYELVWALAYGAVWPLFMAYCFDAGGLQQSAVGVDTACPDAIMHLPPDQA